MNRVYIIAEAGVNHNGDIALAKKMIDTAKRAGADAIKFQTFKAEFIVTKYAKKANYQTATTNSEESQFEMIKKFELDIEAHRKLINRCNQKNINFLSSPFDLKSIELLSNLNLHTFKIPSGEITNLPYLRKIGKLNKNIILSTGMAYLHEIGLALRTLTDSGTALNKIVVLHCNTEYPTPYEDVNLNAMLTIRHAFKVKTGYSDHTLGIEIPIAAVALGASVIEKHFTLDKNMKGPDHKASLDPSELKRMVTAIRNIEKSLGDGQKIPSKSEWKNINIVRKSIVAAKRVKKGEIFSEDNITVKRPGNGISPMLWDEVIGTPACKDFEQDELISL